VAEVHRYNPPFSGGGNPHDIDQFLQSRPFVSPSSKRNKQRLGRLSQPEVDIHQIETPMRLVASRIRFSCPRFFTLACPALLPVATIICFTLTCLYAYISAKEPTQLSFLDPKRKVGILGIMSVLSALLANYLVRSMFERIRWKLVSRDGGILFAEFDALSPNTGPLGCIQRLYWNTRNRRGISKLAPDKRQIFNFQKFLPQFCVD
jgi:hypothetical protein